ncbi:phage tail protein [Enterococcus dongliensis]|uniref:phage tail protein n=1 Tax=Enterococcus dongliensis TaxID=2559925 RepID=UPI002892688B|nr:phage tail protein [Enterococcus dongliensis]MDT2648025.1 phage tail protein [Enterococcus dongliensis]
MIDIIIQNYEKTKKELLVDFNKDSFFENWQENETWEVSFNVTKTDLNSTAFDLVDYESSVIFNGQEFIIKQMTTSAEGQFVSKSVTATHIFYTVQDGFQYNTISGTRAINELLTHVFNGATGDMGFQWEVVNPLGKIGRVEQENFGNANCLKLIEEIMSDYDVVMIPDNKRMTFYSRSDFGNQIQEQIRYKYNTDSVKFDIDTYALKTQIRGFGKKKEGINTENPKDSDYVFTPITYTSPESEKWGIRIQDPVEDERYTVAGNMTERLKQDLQDYPSISGSVTLKWRITPKKGDYVPFIYEPLNIRTYIQVVGLKTYPALPNKPPEITLSNTKKTMTSILASLAKKGVI